ncbi:MAG TPA: ArsA-related P-loop ATPase [Vulgatibacter sp.]|nr:ArsA-related P-loop ATPase [Vulgatibacter sp.]
MLLQLVGARRVVICSGAGGVGKTTTSAALGLAAARAGRHAVVVTVDPARRLADALGLSSLSGEPVTLPRELLDRAGVPEDGALHALMLDPKSTFDELVRRLHGPEEAERILRNRMYENVSGLLAGMQEYAAQEKLHQLHADPRFDLVVVDTPPTRNALDFLEAPDKLSRFLDERVLKWFAPHERKRFGLLQRTGKVVGGVLGRVFGESFVDELAGFLGAIGGMTATLRTHAEEIRRLLASPLSTFLLVTAPEPAALDDAVFFRERLAQLGLPFGGFVVNRVHPDRPELGEEERARTRAALAAELGPDRADALLRKLEASYAQERARALADRALIERLRSEGGAPLVGVPLLEGEISDLAGLARLGDAAFPL